MVRKNENDLRYDKKFFADRGYARSPRGQRGKRRVANLESDRKKLPPNVRAGNIYQFTRTGGREDLPGIMPRSSWEADVMRVLQLYRIQFQFEPRTFVFPTDRYGKTHAYLPDIYLPKTDEFIEVKGYLDSKGRTKMRQFKKCYPEEFSRLIIVISKRNKSNKIFFSKLGVKEILYYEHLTSLFKSKIVNWEG